MNDASPLADTAVNGQTGGVHPLIDVPSLVRVVRGGVALLDVRWRLGGPPGIEAYRRGHLPGAVFIDLDRDLAAPPGPGGRHPLPGTRAFQESMRRAGVRRDDLVVVYDDADATAAARAWWTLRYFGHERVRVLDGGYHAWVDAGQPVTTEVPTVEEGDFTATPGHLPLLDADGALAVAKDGVLLDARAPERYRGEVEPVDPVAGHIPTAISAPVDGNLADGRFRSAADLRSRFEALGADGRSRPVVTSCGSGTSALHHAIAMRLAGLPDPLLYVGSYSDWSRSGEPVLTGPDPGDPPDPAPTRG
jgi:thiosulfate/3-mercaptopyruvate sulfurtransferase